MKNNMISVIVPSYNRKELIEIGINSVLSQNYSNFEIIVVDDGSTDGTEEFIKTKYKDNKNLRFFKNKVNSGAGFSRRFGYNNSIGEYVIFLDDDDYYTDINFFKKAIDILTKNPKVSFVSSSSIIENINEDTKNISKMNIDGLINNADYLLNFQTKYMKSNSTFTTIFRRESLEKANFNEVNMVNDSTIYLRALLAGDAYIMSDFISGIYRIHNKNITFSLNIKFILENLTEKANVAKEIEKRAIFKNVETWLKEQVLLTLSYFIKNNKITNKEFEELINWCKLNFSKEYKEVEEKLKEWNK